MISRHKTIVGHGKNRTSATYLDGAPIADKHTSMFHKDAALQEPVIAAPPSPATPLQVEPVGSKLVLGETVKEKVSNSKEVQNEDPKPDVDKSIPGWIPRTLNGIHKLKEADLKRALRELRIPIQDDATREDFIVELRAALLV